MKESRWAGSTTSPGETVPTPKQPTAILRYWNGEFQKIATDLGYQIRWIAWRKDGNSALAVGNKGLILNFDGKTFERLDSPTIENLRCVSYNPANEALIVGNTGTMLYLSDGKLTRRKVDTEANLRRVSWSPDGSIALAAGNNGTALVWREGEILELTGAFNNLRSVAWHPRGEHALVSGNYFGTSMVPCPTLYTYERRARELKPLKTSEKTDLIGVEWRPDGEYALAAGYEVVWQEPRLFRWTNSELETIPVPEAGLYPTVVAWDPRDDRALIGTGSPFLPGQGEGAVIEYVESTLRRIHSSPYRITCIAWHPREYYAVIVGQANARTFTT